MFGVFSLVLGAAAGAVVWIVVSLANLGIMLLWDLLPKAIGVTAEPGKLGFVIYSLCICIAGGVIIGLWQRKNGILPDETEQVMGRIKRSGSYPYNRIHILVISALLPIIFGGTIGPEAGLIGVIAAICCLVGDILKCKGDEVAALAEAGMAAAVGAIFNAPLFGIADNLESVRGKGKNRKRLVSKKTRSVHICDGSHRRDGRDDASQQGFWRRQRSAEVRRASCDGTGSVEMVRSYARAQRAVRAVLSADEIYD